MPITDGTALDTAIEIYIPIKPILISNIIDNITLKIIESIKELIKAKYDFWIPIKKLSSIYIIAYVMPLNEAQTLK